MQMYKSVELRNRLIGAMQKVIDDIAENDCDVGYFYDGQAEQMAEAALMVLVASADAQEFASKQ